MKKKLLFSSFVSIILCFSLICGATFALFTSESKVNVAVTSGTVKVEAYVKDLPTLSSELGTNLPETTATYSSTDNKVTVTNMVPGDIVNFSIDVVNYSNVTVRYQTEIAVTSDVDNLLEALEITIGDGIGSTSMWETIAPANDVDGEVIVNVPVEIKMPQSVSDAKYQGKTIEFTYTVRAIQGNATDSAETIDNTNGKLVNEQVMTADMPYGTINVTVPAGAQLSSTDLSSLTLTVNKATSGGYTTVATNQVATHYEIYVDGIADYINPFVDGTGRKLYNYSDIKVELPIGTERIDVKVYKDRNMPSTTWASYDSTTGIVTFSVDYFTPFSQAKKSVITVVYTELNEAEKELNETLENVTAGDSVTINSTPESTVYMNNIADALNGSTDISLVGSGVDNTTVVSNSATITSDSLTVKDMTIQSVGTTTIKGNNTTIEGVKYQAAGGGLTVSGSDTTIKNTTVEGAANSGGLVEIASGSDTTSSVTNVSGLTITETNAWGMSNGLKFSNMNGTTNLSNATIKVGGNAVSFGPSNSTVRGYANVSNSTFDSKSVYISTVKASTFDTVTFANTWNTSAITFTAGGATNTFTSCEFKANLDFQSANYANKNVTLIFDNCTYNGVAITAENFDDYFTFENGTFGLQNRDNLTVIVNGTKVIDNK